MGVTKNRILITAAGAACLALLATVPALAGSSSKTGAAHATLLKSVKVTISKKNEFHFTVVPAKFGRAIVTFTIVNGGNLPHDFKVCTSNKGSIAANTCTGRGTAQISPGATGKLRVSFLRAGKYEYLCTLPGHAAAGMKGLLVVS